jgi:alpha-N-arabinofuranosidase
VYDLSDALGVAAGLHEYFRNRDIIQVAHYAQTVNVIGCIKTTKTEAFFDATALPLMLYRHHYGSIPIDVTGDHAKLALDVAAAWTADRKALTIAVVNPNREPKTLELKLDGAALASQGTSWTISGNDPALHNDPGVERLKVVERPIQWTDHPDVPALGVIVMRFPVR